MTTSTDKLNAFPPHVSADLVRNLPIGRGLKTTRHPHDIASDIHRDFPRAFYAPNLMNGGGWVFPRAADQRAVWQDSEHFSSQVIQPFASMAGGKWRMIPVEQDPPEHTTFRRLLMPFFTPKTLATMNEKIRSYARENILSFQKDGQCEFMQDFAFRFPIEIFLEMMDMPLDRAKEFVEWENIMLRDDDMSRVADAVRTVVSYLKGEIEARRTNPGEGFIGFALKAEVEGRKLTEDELMGLCFNLYLGGLDTVSAHLGHIFRHLAEHPEHQKELRADPQKIEPAIDEFLRAYGGVTITRTCIKPIMIGGVKVQKGDRVALSAPLVARDPEEYDEPEIVRFDRRSRTLSFGTGAHLCIGIHLARREIRLALEQFFELIPPFRLQSGTVIESDLGTIMMPFKLPLEWDV